MSRASSSPEIARGQMSSSRPIVSRKSSPFRASRTAEVATASTLSAPALCASRLYLRSTSTARFMAAAERRPRARLRGPQAHHLLLAADHPEGAGLVGVDEDHVQRVAAEVDGGDPHIKLAGNVAFCSIRIVRVVTMA